MSEHTCPDCGSAMEMGFVPDFTWGHAQQMAWHRGEPKPTELLGVKTGVNVSPTQFMPITAYRCSGGGVLRFYAKASK